MAIVFALLTALANALAVTLQHIASTARREKSTAWRLFVFLARHPLWLLGWVAMAGSLVFQALALHFGPLSLVQPFLVSELVLALVARRIWLHQRIRSLTWSAATVTSVGLVVFLVITSPSERALAPSSHAWTISVVVCVAASAALVAAAQRGSPTRRAALFAGATAIMWALEATFIKATTVTLVIHGIGGMLARWPLYALIIGGVAGLACEQAALHVGPLKVSQPLIVIVDPLVSIGLGVWLFRERLHGGPVQAVVAGAAFAAMCAGVVVLTRSAPSTMEADIPHL